MGKIKIMFCSFPDYSSNAKPLYEYMKKRYKDSMNMAWAVLSDESVEKLSKMGIEAYKIGTDEYFEYAKNTDVFFSTHCNITGERNEKSIYVELWHGISSKHIGNLSDNMTEDDRKWYNHLRKNIDYMVVPSDFWRVIFSTRFNIEYNRTVSLGYPKLDYFVYSDSRNNLSKVLDIDITKYNKILYYMPTFRKGCNREQESEINTNNIFNLESYKEQELIDFLHKKNYLLCIKKHPSEELNLNYIECDNIKIITEEKLNLNNITLNEIINAADLMITDYSSLGIEFVFLNKPVVYLVNDIEEYREKRGITFNNSNFWMPGFRVKKLNELIFSIENSLSNDKDYSYKADMEEKKKMWFGDLKDGGCANICDFLFDGDKLRDGIKHYVSKEDYLENKINYISDELQKKENVIIELKDELQKVYNSKGWIFLEKVRKIFRG